MPRLLRGVHFRSAVHSPLGFVTNGRGFSVFLQLFLLLPFFGVGLCSILPRVRCLPRRCLLRYIETQEEGVREGFGKKEFLKRPT